MAAIGRQIEIAGGAAAAEQAERGKTDDGGQKQGVAPANAHDEYTNDRKKFGFQDYTHVKQPSGNCAVAGLWSTFDVGLAANPAKQTFKSG